MRLADVQHQPRATGMLRRALASGRVHHAYLFDGPDGVGKERCAAALAARLLCQRPGEADPLAACDACDACRMMASAAHPDFHLVHRGLHKFHPDRSVRATKGLFLGIDVVRHFLIEPAASAPSCGLRRVFVVRDAERMNEDAQNALLKTLEEPPGAAVFVLVTASADRLLPTIRSRCQRLPFDLLPQAFVMERLQAAGAAPQAAALLAEFAQGRLGAAIGWGRIGLLEALPIVEQALQPETTVAPEAFGKQLTEAATALAQRSADEAAGASPAESGPADDRAPAVDDEDDEGGGRAVSTDELRAALKLVLMLMAGTLRTRLREMLQHDADEDALLAQADGVQACFEAERMLDRNVQPQLTLERLAVALRGECTRAIA